MRNYPVSLRLYLLIAASLAMTIGALTYSLFQSYDALVHERRLGLAQINDQAISIFDKYHKMETEGTLTREEAQRWRAGLALQVGAVTEAGDEGGGQQRQPR